MTNAEREATIAHNLHYIRKMLDKQAVANVSGATCPKCGEGANPTIVARFGHCLKCQNATIGR